MELQERECVEQPRNDKGGMCLAAKEQQGRECVEQPRNSKGGNVLTYHGTVWRVN